MMNKHPSLFSNVDMKINFKNKIYIKRIECKLSARKISNFHV